jgi:hypothetical protein
MEDDSVGRGYVLALSPPAALRRDIIESVDFLGE